MSLISAVFLRGSAFSASAAIAVGIFGYLTRRILANHLPGNDYAFFYSVFALINLLVIPIQAGTADVLLFEVPGILEAGKRRCAGTFYRFIVKFQSVNALCGMILFLLCFPLLRKYYFDYPVSALDFGIFTLLIWGIALENTTLFTLNTLKKFGLMSGLRTVKAGLFFLGACLCLAGNNLTWIILVCTAATTVCTGFGDRAARHSGMLPGTFAAPGKVKKNIIGSGLIFMLLAVGGTVMQDLGTMVLAFFSPARDVVLFNIALPISMIVQSLLTVLNVFNPLIAECCARNDRARLKKLFTLLFILTAAAMAAAAPVLYFGGEFLITLLFSEKFVAAKWCTFFLVEAALLSIPVRALFNLFNTANRKQVSLRTLIPFGIAALLLFPLLTIRYGASGTGLAVLLTTAVWLVAYLFHYAGFLTDEQDIHS